MESVVHSQFGTVDNPALIFTSDSSWRIVICMGPGIEDDSNSHEKMYYFVREGPIHRCQICGQCFKLVRLKDEFSEMNDYYSLMFSQLTHFEVSEEDYAGNMTSFFGDRPQGALQTVPGTSVYIHVNADEADRILVDPAYKLERLKEAHEKLYALHQAYREVERQMEGQRYALPIPYGKDLYESWWNIEKKIRKLDRIFNKVEKFNSRKLTDPYNHERREKRMLESKRDRWIKNYTYFFGGLTEEEQMYRDYYETDMENDPESELIEDKCDEADMLDSGDFDHAHFDFVETSLLTEPHENYEDVIEQKVFKYKYRQACDSEEIFLRRNGRMMMRFMERAQVRDPSIDQDLHELFHQDNIDTSLSSQVLDPTKFGNHLAREETAKIRDYMVDEAERQYRDYYETDGEEQEFFEFMDNMPARDKIRFAEIFEDFTIDTRDNKDYVSISKREYNPELSVFSNLYLDMVDFKDRVRPLAKDMAMWDVSRDYQRQSASKIMEEYEKNQLSGETAQTEEVEAEEQAPKIEATSSEEGASSEEEDKK